MATVNFLFKAGSSGGTANSKLRYTDLLSIQVDSELTDSMVNFDK